MKVKRIEDNSAFALISVKPWPDEPFAADVTIIQDKCNPDTGEQINRVRVRFGQFPLPIDSAFRFAQAILRAVDIAKRLEEEGSILLEGEGEARICVSCERAVPPTDTLDKDLCDACVTEAYQHKPGLYAQIALEGGGSYTQPLDTLSVAIDAELDGAEVGTKLTIEVISMTPAEYAALPEFDGH